MQFQLLHTFIFLISIFPVTFARNVIRPDQLDSERTVTILPHLPSPAPTAVAKREDAIFQRGWQHHGAADGAAAASKGGIKEVDLTNSNDGKRDVGNVPIKESYEGDCEDYCEDESEDTSLDKRANADLPEHQVTAAESPAISATEASIPEATKATFGLLRSSRRTKRSHPKYSTPLGINPATPAGQEKA